MSDRPLVAGLDVGTTGVKCLVVDPETGPLAATYVEHRPARPAPDRVEQDPAVLAVAIDGALARAVRRTRRHGRIEAVGVTGARATFAAVDRAGRPVTPFLIWQDQRAAGLVERLAATVGAERYFGITGLPLGPIASAAKLRWLAEADARRWQRVDGVVTGPGFALRRLGAGRSVVTPSAAAYLGLLDLGTRAWSSELPAAFGITEAILPAVVPEGAIVGGVSAEAALRTGLEAGTHLVAAPSDWACTLVGGGAIEPGRAMAYLGTGGALGAVVAGPILVAASGLSCLPAAAGGWAALEGLLITGAAGYRWYRDLLARERSRARGNRYLRLERAARRSPVGARGVLTIPTFAGAGAPRPDPLARAGVVGIGLDTEAGDLVRSLIEGVALDLVELVEAVGATAGAPVEQLALTGPPAGSTLWTRIVADALGVPVSTVHPSDPTTLGAAAVASVSDGGPAGPDPGALGAAVRRLARRARTVRPRPDRTALYRELLGVRRDLVDRIRAGDIDARLAAIRGRVVTRA